MLREAGSHDDGFVHFSKSLMMDVPMTTSETDLSHEHVNCFRCSVTVLQYMPLKVTLLLMIVLAAVLMGL